MNTYSNRNWERFALWAFLFVILASTILIMVKLGSTTAPGVNATLSDPVTASDWSKGNPDAKVTLVEYSDFQCPACKIYQPVINELLKDYEGKLRIVYRHFPLSTIHANAKAGAWASESAGKQNKFWEMHDLLFINQDSWSSLKDPFPKFNEFAQSLQLDQAQFKKDYESSDVKNKVDEQYSSGTRSQVSSTPSIFLNGKKIQNPRDYNELSAIIKQAIDANP